MSQNPLSFKDFFDFSDNSVIRQAVAEIDELTRAYKDWQTAVTGSQIETLNNQQKELAATVKELASSTQTLSITTKEGQKALTDNSAALAELTTKLQGVARAKTESKAADDILSGSVDGLTARLKAQLAEFNKLDPAVEGNLERLLQLGKATQDTRVAIQQLTNETKVSAAAFTVAKGSYLELDAQTKQLKKDLFALADGFNPANKEAQELAAQIAINTERLKAFDNAIGINNRNVGNYKSAFNGLNVATSQIFRELPSAVVSLNTFFLAISNNLPILFDEIAKTKAQIAALKTEQLAAATAAEVAATAAAVEAGAMNAAAVAAGNLAREQALANTQSAVAPSLLKALGSAVLNVNTLLTLAVVALTFFGGRIIDFFTGSSEASKKAAEDAKKYNQRILDISAAARVTQEVETFQLEAYNRTATNTKLAIDARYSAAEKMQKLYPEILGNLTQEEILEGRATVAILKSRDAIIAKAQASANEKKLQAAVEEQDKQEQNRLQAYIDLQKAINVVRTQTQEGRKAFAGDKAPTTPTEVDAALKKAIYAANLEDIKAIETSTNIAKDLIEKKKNFDLLTISAANSSKEVSKYAGNIETLNNKLAGTKLQAAANSLAAYQERLDLIGKELQKVVIGSADFIRLQKEQTELQAKIDSANGKSTQAEKDSDKAAALLRKQLAAAEAARRKADELAKKGAELEIAEADKVYARSLKTAADQQQLEQSKYDIITKYAELRLRIFPKDTKGFIDAQKDKEKAEADYLAARVKIYDENQKKVDDINKGLRTQVTSTIKASGDIAVLNEQIGLEQKIDNIRLLAARHAITQKQSENEIHLLKVQQLQDEIANEKARAENILNNDEAILAAKKSIAEKERRLAAENADYELKKEQEKQHLLGELRQAGFQFASTAAAGYYDIQQAFLERELSDLQTQHDYEITLAGDNANAKTAIDKKFKAQESIIKRQEAEASKQGSILQIGITTAENIVKAYPNPYLIAAAAALGALEIGIVASKPIPNYFVGRSSGPAEIANVNERGFELIGRPGNYRIEGGGAPTVAKLEAGDQVLTHEQSIKKIADDYIYSAETDAFLSSILEGQNIVRAHETQTRKELVSAIAAGAMSREALTASFRDALQDLPIEQNIFDAQGHRKFEKRKNLLLEKVHERQTMGGNG